MPFEARTENQKLTLTRSLTSSVTTQINFCSIFVKTRPGTIKRSFRIENRSSSLADSRGETPPPPSAGRVRDKVGRVCELTKSSRPKFNMVWRQFSTVQFPIHHLSGKFVQFSSGYGGQVPPFSSFSSVQFSSQTFPVLTQIDLTGLVRLSISSVHRVSNCLRGVEEQF